MGAVALKKNAEKHLSGEPNDAFNHGIKAYQALSLLVRPHEDSFGPNIHSSIAAINNILSLLNAHFLTTLETADQRLSKETPYAHSAIGASAIRFYKDHEQLVLQGAGVMRELYLESILR